MSRPRGFTLVEVLVALTLGALVVLLAHRTLAQASDLSERLAAARERHDRAMNARRFLGEAFGSLDVGAGPNAGFDGKGSSVRFVTWRPNLLGVPEREHVTIEAGATGLQAVAGRDTLVLVPGARAVAFDYLLDFGADAGWVRGWSSAASAPLAVRLRVQLAEPVGAVDTLLFAIGPRG